MREKAKYVEVTDAPNDVRESFDRAVIVPNFELTPEGIKAFVESRAKKPVNIYLSTQTVEKFKNEAKRTGKRYQTMINDVLDAYAHQYL
ncbi:MAG: BrnA antitoxin family protein [Defluviitaleaceae bacterium]|nr:BrnA antitoxin family protein [Defluviitaleaceae bacterium]